VVEFVVGRRKGYGGFFELRRFAQRRFATLIIVQAKLTVNLCYLHRISYTESPAGTARRCEFDFAHLLFVRACTYAFSSSRTPSFQVLDVP
jgi:hypothetical protein